jgi:hypothetical protein
MEAGCCEAALEVTPLPDVLVAFPVIDEVDAFDVLLIGVGDPATAAVAVGPVVTRRRRRKGTHIKCKLRYVHSAHA